MTQDMAPAPRQNANSSSNINSDSAFKKTNRKPSSRGSCRRSREAIAKGKEFAVLELICRFGLSSKKVASHFVDDPRRNVVRSLLNKRWICTRRKATSPPITSAFYIEPDVLVLTEAGLRVFYLSGGEGIVYRETDPAKVNLTHASHTLEGQIVIKRLLMLRLISQYATERMIDPKDKKGPKKFDLEVMFITSVKSEVRVGIEIELSCKYGRAMCETRERICLSLKEKDDAGQARYAHVFYFIQDCLIGEYQKKFSAGQEVYRWKKASEGGYRPGEVALTIPSYIASKIMFFPVVGYDESGAKK